MTLNEDVSGSIAEIQVIHPKHIQADQNSHTPATDHLQRALPHNLPAHKAITRANLILALALALVPGDRQMVAYPHCLNRLVVVHKLLATPLHLLTDSLM